MTKRRTTTALTHRPELDGGQHKTLREVEHEHIDATLRRTGGNMTQAARMLGIDRRTMYRKLAEIERSYAEQPVAIQEVE